MQEPIKRIPGKFKRNEIEPYYTGFETIVRNTILSDNRFSVMQKQISAIRKAYELICDHVLDIIEYLYSRLKPDEKKYSFIEETKTI